MRCWVLTVVFLACGTDHDDGRDGDVAEVTDAQDGAGEVDAPDADATADMDATDDMDATADTDAADAAESDTADSGDDTGIDDDASDTGDDASDTAADTSEVLGEDTADAADVADDATPPIKVAICHQPDGDLAPEILLVTPDEAEVHFADGDVRGYVSDLLEVSAAGALDGVGTAEAPMRRIGDALRLVRCAHRADGARRTIRVSAGLYRLSFDAAALSAHPDYDAAPLVLDVPLHLAGAAGPALDGDGVPEADYAPFLDPAGATILEPDRALAAEALVVVADTSDVAATGLVLRSGHCRVAEHCPDAALVTTRNGTGIVVVRAHDVTLSDNVFFPGFSNAIDGWQSDLRVERSFATDTDICGFCFSGTGRYEILANRVEDGLGGIFVAGGVAPRAFSVALGAQAGDLAIPDVVGTPETRVDFLVAGNVLTRHFRSGTAFGVRVIAFGRNASGFSDDVSVVGRVLGNTIAAPDGSPGAHNGVLVDAGFSDRKDKPMSATLFVELGGNAISALRKPVVVITTRAQTITNASVSSWKTNTVLDQGAFVLDTDLSYPDAFWVDHFAADLLSGNARSGGTCAADTECATGAYRGVALGGSCLEGSCVCPAAMIVDAQGLCQDPTPVTTQVVINGAVVAPGTTLPAP